MSAPYDGAEVQVGAVFAPVGRGVLGAVAVAVAASRWPRWPAVVFRPATAVLLVTPCPLFALNGSTVPQVPGKGLLW